MGPDGKMSDLESGGILEAVNKFGKKRENLNFFFVIEGTRETAAHKASILSAIENIDRDLPSFVKIKYGAVIYNDVYLSKTGKHLKIVPLSEARTSVIQSVNDFNFDQGFDDTDKNTIIRHALVQGLNKGKFSKDEINFIIVIGNGPDFYYDTARNITAEADGYGDFACHPCDVELNEKLEELEVNLLVVQATNEATKLSEKLLKDFRSRMLNTSNSMYDKYSKLTQTVFKRTTVPAPEMAEIDASTNQFELENGVLHMKIIRKANGMLSMAELMKQTNEFALKSFNKIDDLYKEVKKIAESDAVNLKEGTNEWSPKILHLLGKSAKSDILDEIAKQKIKLHNPIYLARPKGEHPAYSYCVFMPETELVEYITQLGQLKEAARGTPDQQRSTLASTMESLVRKFNGDKSMAQVQKTTIDEVRLMMAGIKEATYFELEDKLSFPISGIKDKKILSDAKLQEILGKFSSKLTSLNSIKAQGKGYEFSYSLNDDAVYYWIPVSSLF
jgi:hypothetical protein